MSALQIISHPIHNVTERSGRNPRGGGLVFFDKNMYCQKGYILYDNRKFRHEYKK